MKNIAIIVTLLLFSLASSFAQTDSRVKPKSTQFNKSVFSELQEIALSPFSQQEADRLDDEDAVNGRIPKIARNIATNITLANSGNWAVLPGGDRVWRVQLTSKNALGIIPLFDNLYLPPGATLHVYDPLMSKVIGAFTHANSPAPRSFCPGLIEGESCIIEYYEPAVQSGKGILSINEVGHAYRGLKDDNSVQGGSGSCEVNTVCPEGDDWRNQIRSSCRVFVVTLHGEGYCSGALINNTRLDCTPYVLSAGHCTDNDSVTGSEFGEWIFTFNYNGQLCTDTSSPDTLNMYGCTRVAYAYDDDGNYGSDFLLLRLYSYPPASYNLYYSGWDLTANPAQSGVCIHHPLADISKISTFSSPAVSSSWAANVFNTHWQVSWVGTLDGWGVTEPGSSGSPLYEPQGLIVGHLTGGASACGGPFGPDRFGKVSFDWTSNGVTPDHQLQPWLDPDSTGVNSLQGMNPPCGAALTHDAGLQSITGPVGNTCSTTFLPCVTLRNFGDDTLATANINYQVDNGTVYTFAWSGFMPGGADTVICLPEITVGTGAHEFSCNVSQPNGAPDSNTGNDSLQTSFTVYPFGYIDVIITTDNDGNEDTWQITQDSAVVASGGPFVPCVGGRQYIYPLCLPPGCYVFTIFNSEGQGMTAGEDGNVQIYAGVTLLTQLRAAAFGLQESDSFCITSSAIAEVPDIRVQIIPNPSNGLFNVYFDDNTPKDLKLFDALGNLVLERNCDAQHLEINITGYSSGVYFAEFSSGNGKAVRKLVLE